MIWLEAWEWQRGGGGGPQPHDKHTRLQHKLERKSKSNVLNFTYILAK